MNRALVPTLVGGLALVGACAPAPRPPSVQAGHAVVRVVAYNIKHGRGMDDRVDLVRQAAVLGRLDADVIALQEVDVGTERTDRVDQPGELARLLGGAPAYASSHGPHRAYRGGWYGNAILSRLPVRAVRTHPIPPAGGSALAVHEVEVTAPTAGPTSGPGALSVVSVHLAGSVAERTAQAAELTRLFAGTGHPVLLVGDFNGRPDDAAVRRLVADGWRVVGKTGDRSTYPADDPDREIDFAMLGPPGIGDTPPGGTGGGSAWIGPGAAVGPVRVVDHRVVPEPTASDHRPLLLVIEIRRPGG